MANGNPFGNSGVETIDPRAIGKGAATATDSANESGISTGIGTGIGDTGIGQPKRRGRPKGSKNRAQAAGLKAVAQVPVDRDAISAILLSIHAMVAGMAKIPELALDKSEANSVADAAAKVASLYDLTADIKVIAWSNLAMSLGMVYGTRIVAIRERKKSERIKRQSKIVSINGVTPSVLGSVKLPEWDTGPVNPQKKN